MRIEQVAAQLYTLRDHLKTADQVAKTLKQVKRIGYEAVQLSGIGPIETKEIKKMLDGEGLVCCATHENSQTILESPDAVAEKLSILGCKHTAYPYPAGIDFSTPRSLKDFAKRLNEAGAKLRASGVTLSYHNHDIEFMRTRGTVILDFIYESTDPENIKAELDTHWVQAGGGSMTAWIRKLAGRMPLIHLKDFAVAEDRSRRFAEIGHGNMDWNEIITAAEGAGCDWFIVEQDSDWADNDPFKSLKMSFRYLKDKIAS